MPGARNQKTISIATVTLLGLFLICGHPVIALKNSDPVVVGKTFLAGSTDPRTGSTAWALTSHSARITACNAAHNGILSQVPVSNLVTPAWHVGLSTRMAEYKPWGSDYYVIRADFHEVASKANKHTATSSAPIFGKKTSFLLALVLIAFGIY